MYYTMFTKETYMINIYHLSIGLFDKVTTQDLLQILYGH
jgi:hypothetical protein